MGARAWFGIRGCTWFGAGCYFCVWASHARSTFMCQSLGPLNVRWHAGTGSSGVVLHAISGFSFWRMYSEGSPSASDRDIMGLLGYDDGLGANRPLKHVSPPLIQRTKRQ